MPSRQQLSAWTVLDRAMAEEMPYCSLHKWYDCEKDGPCLKKAKANYIGAPAVFLLEMACRGINESFGNFGCYLVGSCLERADWRDVDVRFVMEDAEFVTQSISSTITRSIANCL